jgi:maltooligosyltrehalose trehalohydrolase
MTAIAVWAPRAESVELQQADLACAPMVRDERGWWRPVVPYTGRYRLVVDGSPLPDPRSPSQPTGFDGWSETVDHATFPWTDRDWHGFPLGDAVIYELHVGTFTPEGTFDAVIGRLDHLVGLGIDAIELMPVNTFPGDRGWGYDGVLLYAPHVAYGGPDGLKRLVDACHGRGVAVVADVVYNHLGPLGNHLARFGPYFTDAYRTPWGDAVNLDGAGSDEVRRFVVDDALQWVRDYHVDGLRLDAVHAFFDRSAVHLLEQLATEVHALAGRLGREVWVIAESDLNDPSLVREVAAGGKGLDATWSDDLHHALHALLTGEGAGYYADFGSVAQLARALEQVYVFAGDYSHHRQRSHGRPVGALARGRFLAYSQNHDQVGNRAVGDRLAHIAGIDAAQAAAALVLCGPFVPLLFQGEEWAASTPFQYFTSHPDPELGDAVRRGRAAEFAAFGWDVDRLPDPQDVATFDRSKLRWDELDTEPHATVLRWYRSLLGLRAARCSLRADDPAATSVAFDEDRRWLTMRRGELVVAVALPAPTGASGRTTVPLPVRCDEVVLSNDPSAALAGGSIDLARGKVAIVEHHDA